MTANAPSATPLLVVRLAHPSSRAPNRRWLIDGLWAEEACGCIGGTPKSCKTWLGLEMALAVATGRPCLGRFAVPNPGPVLLYAAEDAASAIRERAAALALARRLPFERIAVGLITEEGLRLDLDAHRDRLEATVAQLKPRLLILDPLVRLHRGDENSAAEVSEILGWLRVLNRAHKVAIALVRHVRKSGGSQPGQSLRGSGDIHAWGDSNLYLLRRKEQLFLQAEHRSHPAPPPLPLRLHPDPTHLVIEDEPVEDGQAAPGDSLEARIIEALARRPMNRGELRDHLRARNESVGQAIADLVACSKVVLHDGRWSVPVPARRDQRERNASRGV